MPVSRVSETAFREETVWPAGGRPGAKDWNTLNTAFLDEEQYMSNTGNSNTITREYLDSLLIETRFMDSTNPTLDFELYGRKFSSPIMTAALSHLDQMMFPGAAHALAKGARDANAVLWYGMADDEEIDRLAAEEGVSLIEIIKPYSDRGLIYRKIKHAEEKNLLAVGIDIDHPFGEDGSPDVVDGFEMTALRTEELADICRSTSLPLIAKGVLSVHDAECCLSAGVSGLVLSHHNNRINYAIPPLAVLPEILEVVKGQIPVFVDDEIRTGMDAFKALAQGAAGVCIGRPLMAAIKEDPENGAGAYLKNANRELAKAMAYTGCTDLTRMDPTVIRTIDYFRSSRMLFGNWPRNTPAC